MKKLFVFVFVGGIALFSFGEAASREEPLTERYRKWLEEEVAYIILPLEKEVFRQLQTDREREMFIEAFWRQRDPTPGAPENEFRNEHYRRINHANRFFGRGTPKQGWRTDRGRVYIILGEPNDIQRFDGKSTVYPAEVWFYQGKTDLGLPPGFHLVFFQPGGIGEYRLYSPSRDGPMALLTSYWGGPGDYYQAYQQLLEIEPALAGVSLSLIPGDTSAMSGRPSLASDILIQNVETAPRRSVEEKYARKFLQYKDIVEVEYTANYIDSDSAVIIVKEEPGLYFVHYMIEPARLSVHQYERKYSTILRVNGTVRDLEGRAVFQFERPVSIEFDEDHMKSIGRQPFQLHDMFPLIPGHYTLSILVKNEVSKEFTSLERDLVIPGDDAPLQMTSLILGHKATPFDPSTHTLKPFQMGNHQIFSQPNKVFTRKESLILAFQIHGLDPDLRQRAEIRYLFLKEGEEFKSYTRSAATYPQLPHVLETVPLDDFPPAYYRVQAILLIDGLEAVADGENFVVSFMEAIPRPWIQSRIFPRIDHPVYAYLIGTQLFNRGNLEDAQSRLEKAFHGMPDSLDFAMNLAQVYLATGSYDTIVSILRPFYDRSDKSEYRLYTILGQAYQNLGEWNRAIEVFDGAASHFGINAPLLNALGECYFRLGRVRDALAVWEKSLEMLPDQPQIKKQVEAIKEK